MSSRLSKAPPGKRQAWSTTSSASTPSGIRGRSANSSVGPTNKGSVVHYTYRQFCLFRGPSAFYFTILRDPVDVFVSLWDYYELAKKYGVSLDEYARREKVGDLKDRLHKVHGRNEVRLHCIQ